jgi:hypothetical protein
MVEGNIEAVSRREILSTSLRTLVLVTILTGSSAATGDAQPKMAQKIVQYRDTPNKDQSCSACLHFLPPNRCQLVDGGIKPDGWCTLFAPRTKPS